mgnify:CR=1 FL=1|jgi:DNA-binding protein
MQERNKGIVGMKELTNYVVGALHLFTFQWNEVTKAC